MNKGKHTLKNKDRFIAKFSLIESHGAHTKRDIHYIQRHCLIYIYIFCSLLSFHIGWTSMVMSRAFNVQIDASEVLLEFFCLLLLLLLFNLYWKSRKLACIWQPNHRKDVCRRHGLLYVDSMCWVSISMDFYVNVCLINYFLCFINEIKSFNPGCVCMCMLRFFLFFFVCHYLLYC